MMNLFIRYKRDHAKNWFDIKLDPLKMVNDMEIYYNKFDIPLATVSIYGYDYLYRKIAEMGYENIYTGAGGDYLQKVIILAFYIILQI